MNLNIREKQSETKNNKNKLLINCFLVIMVALLFYSIGYGQAYSKSVAYANEFVAEFQQNPNNFIVQQPYVEPIKFNFSSFEVNNET